MQSLNEHHCTTSQSASCGLTRTHNRAVSKTTSPDSTDDHTYSVLHPGRDSSFERQSVTSNGTVGNVQNMTDDRHRMDMKLDHNLNIASESQVSRTSQINSSDMSDMPVLLSVNTSPVRKYNTRGMRIPDLEKQDTSPSQIHSFVKEEVGGKPLREHGPTSSKVLTNMIILCTSSVTFCSKTSNN